MNKDTRAKRSEHPRINEKPKMKTEKSTSGFWQIDSGKLHKRPKKWSTKQKA